MISTLADDVIRWHLGRLNRDDVKYCLDGADSFRDLTDSEYEEALDQITKVTESRAEELEP